VRSASAGFPSRWRLASSTACSALALVAAGCGGEEAALEPSLGDALAAHAADVRERLAQGDPIGAHAEAEQLEAVVEQEIAAGRVPPELAAELRDAADRLARLAAAAVPAPEPPPPPPPPVEEDDGDGKGKGKGKGKDKGDEGDGDDG
jgi:hypothetical protein